MDNFSQEHLDKLVNRRQYLAQLLAQSRKKVNHRNWVVSMTHGIQMTLKAQESIFDELVRTDIEIDFLTGFLAG